MICIVYKHLVCLNGWSEGSEIYTPLSSIKRNGPDLMCDVYLELHSGGFDRDPTLHKYTNVDGSLLFGRFIICDWVIITASIVYPAFLIRVTT
jgi:hypothetical protein